ncbi:hypothetical protein MKX08_006268 [Trichoderma sp. CBMAI-0020]|nr:hypothetical protein MKX08_006268 [Trichoderma sp. CBMAI-0020]
MDNSHTGLDLWPAQCSGCSRTTLALSPPPRHEAPRPRTLSRCSAELAEGSCAASRTEFKQLDPQDSPSSPNPRQHSQYMLPLSSLEPRASDANGGTPYEKNPSRSQPWRTTSMETPAYAAAERMWPKLETLVKRAVYWQSTPYEQYLLALPSETWSCKWRKSRAIFGWVAVGLATQSSPVASIEWCCGFGPCIF